MSVRRRMLGAAVLGAVVSFLPSSPALAGGTIQIVRIHYKQTGTNLDTEYVVLKNATGAAIQMKGWQMISSPSTDNQRYTFPSTKVASGATLTLYTGKGTNTATKRYWGSTSPVWNNSGDYAVLRNASGKTVDTCRYAGGGTTAYC